MTGVQGLGGNVGDGLHTARHGYPDGVVDEQGLHQIHEQLPVGVVLDHADLLTDDALLLVHALLCEVGHGDEGEQNAQILLKILGGFKVIPGDGGAGKSVGGRTLGCQILQGVSVLSIEHLMLQIVGHTGGGIVPLPIQTEAHIVAAVIGGEEGVALLEAGLGEYEHVQTVFQLLVVQFLPHAGVIQLLHGVRPPFPSGSTRYPAPGGWP